ncbi:MAG: hypothetical protein OEV85_06625 [Candidatus Thorarchaeota archaeon]|nr:hypothetical protein [Candidatus Thorarchaeota archaeon]
MVESPVISKSIIFYQIGIFVIIQVWAIMAFDIAQYQMVTLYETPFEWLGWASLLFLTLMPILSVLAWKMKENIEFKDIEWNYKLREVNFNEFSLMIKGYNQSYRQIIATLDVRLLPLSAACFMGALFLPFPLMRLNPLVIALTPIIIAVFLVVFGLLFSYLVFKFVPNSATHEFPTYEPHTFRTSISFLSHLPGIFWSGVRLTIGEAGGFYTIRKPHPVARIEGIEGAVRIDCTIDHRGSISDMTALVDSENSQESSIIGRIEAPITTLDAVHLIRKTLEMYIKSKEDEDLLEDVLEEIDAFLGKHDHLKARKKSSDGLISSGDKSPAKEERT